MGMHICSIGQVGAAWSRSLVQILGEPVRGVAAHLDFFLVHLDNKFSYRQKISL